MAGEVGHDLKKALLALLRQRYAAVETNRQVEVKYAAAGIPERERVHGGAVRCDQEYAAYASGVPSSPRQEEGTVEINVEVYHRTADVEATDDRCRELARVLEELVGQFRVWNGQAAEPPVPELSWCKVRSFESEFYYTDEGAGSIFGYVIAYKARLAAA